MPEAVEIDFLAANGLSPGGRFLCGVDSCARSFVKNSALTLHQKKRHAEHYHRLQANNIKHVNKRWTEEELGILAKRFIAAELECPSIRSIAQRLSEMDSSRTLESIRGAFKKESFKNLVAEIKAKRTGVIRDTPTHSERQKQEWLEDIRNHLPADFDPDSVTPGESCEDNLLKVDAYYETFNSRNKPSKEPRVTGARALPAVVKTGGTRRVRRFLFRKVQRAYGLDRSRLAEKVLDGTWNADQPLPDPGAMEDFWRGVFETESKQDSRQVIPVRQPQWNMVRPVLVSDVEESLKNIDNSTAAGPDGRRKSDILSIPVKDLTGMFNTWLYSGCLPRPLLTGYTTLVPKEVGTTDPAKHRPLTVQSLLVRAFHRILACRLENDCPVSVRQKGFRPGDGLAQNVKILETLLRKARRHRKRLFLVYLDVRKAFDSVSHHSLLKACQRAGVPTPMLSYIDSIYKGACTRLKVNGLLSDPIRVLQGVKQGDPLSSVLFNLTIDWAAEYLDEHIGVTLGQVKVSYLAFADDIVLLAESPVGLENQANCFAKGLKACGLYLNAGKCATMAIDCPPHEKRWVACPDPFLRLGPDLVPAISIESTYKYLGLQFSFHGPSVGVLVKLKRMLENMRKAPLKPQQRLWILKTKVIPSLYHDLVLANLTFGQLKDLDRRIRDAVRSWLKLPKDTPIPFFYARVKDGGIGLDCLEFHVPFMKRQRLLNLMTAEDPVVREACKDVSFRVEIQKWGQRKMYGGYLMNSPDLAKVGWRESLLATVDGRGLKQAADVPFVHRWVDSGLTTMCGRNYCAAVAIRAGVIPTPARVARGRPLKRKTCLTCGPNAVENLLHISQTCPRSHGMRVNRHDKILGLLAKSLADKGWVVEPELRIKTTAGLRKPDLLVYRPNEQAWIIDVTVVADICEDLDTPYKDKIEKYSKHVEISNAVIEKAGVAPTFSAFVLNYRGVYSPGTASDMALLGLTRSRLIFLALICVEQTSIVHRLHQASNLGIRRYREVAA